VLFSFIKQNSFKNPWNIFYQEALYNQCEQVNGRLLRTTRMARIEVAVPTEKTDGIIRSISKLGFAHFIDLTETKENKYKTLTQKVESSDRETLLLQLSNRIDNMMKKLREIPYPEPVIVKDEESSEILKRIEDEVGKIEVENAKVENMMKEAAEEKASLERDLHQFREEYDGIKKTLSEYEVNLDVLARLDRKMLAYKDKLRKLHSRLMDFQKTLVYIEMAGKMNVPDKSVSNNEDELRKIKEYIRETFELQEKIRRHMPEAEVRLSKIEDMLHEVRDVVERKIEAIEKLRELKASVKELQGIFEDTRQSLSEDLLLILGKSLQSTLEETADIIRAIDALKLGSPNVEEATQKTSKNAYEILKEAEILEGIDKYLALHTVKKIVDEVRGEGRTSEIKALFERSREFLASVPLEHLKMLHRAVETLHLEQRIRELEEEPSRLTKKLKDIAENSPQIHAYKEVVDIETSIEKLKKKFRKTIKTSVFEVWVKAPDVQKAVDTIKVACPDAVVNITEEEEGEDRSPTLMRNPRIATCYQKLVGAFGLPNYHEVDPSLIMLVTFPLVFGLMFGDIGHGLILLVGGILIKPIFDKFRISGEMFDPLRDGRVLIVSCGVASILFGFLYGEFFGPTTLSNPHTPNWYTALTGIPHAPWFSPSEAPSGPLKLLEIAIIVGMIQISFGIILDVVNKILNREFRESLAPISWIWFYWSICYLLLTYKLNIGRVILDPKTLGIFIIAPFVGMLVLHRLTEDFMGAFSETVTKAIESISNTASYGRILALGMAHVIFSEIALLGSGFMFWPTMILVTIFMIIALEGILTFAHTLRLHWIEWFSKYYKGDGVAFEGFTIRRRFTVAV